MLDSIIQNLSGHKTIKMRKRLIIYSVLTLMTCVSALGQSPGNYISAEGNLFERGLRYLGGKGFVLGNDLTLNADSSFLMTTCGTINTGKWYVNEDSLYLEVKSRKWRSDSLQEVGYLGKWPKMPTRPLTYKIIRNGFYREFYLEYENRKFKAGDKLIKKK